MDELPLETVVCENMSQLKNQINSRLGFDSNLISLRTICDYDPIYDEMIRIGDKTWYA